jgi:hypothetical protein
MGTDYAEKERTFIAGLEEDTGRGLDAWMSAIDQSGMTSRNDIIDWLRLNGFAFADASWIERIHHNGGRLVYAEDGPPGVSLPPPIPGLDRPPMAEPRAKASAPRPPPVPEAVLIAPEEVIAPGPELAANAPLSPAVAELLSAAKGLRPLAALALREVQSALPGTILEADGLLLRFCGPKPFLALLPGAKALRLYGDFGASADSRVARAEAAMKVASKAPPPFPSVLVLTDARLVDAAFLTLVRSAHARAHS